MQIFIECYSLTQTWYIYIFFLHDRVINPFRYVNNCNPQRNIYSENINIPCTPAAAKKIRRTLQHTRSDSFWANAWARCSAFYWLAMLHHRNLKREEMIHSVITGGFSKMSPWIGWVQSQDGSTDECRLSWTQPISLNLSEISLKILNKQPKMCV